MSSGSDPTRSSRTGCSIPKDRRKPSAPGRSGSMTEPSNRARATHRYVRTCYALARAWARLRVTHGAKNSPKDAPELSSALKLAGLPADSETVLNASRMATFLVCIVFVSASAVCVFVVGLEESLLLVLMTILIPLLIGEVIKGYPRVLSRRLASEVVKDSTGAISLMVMSLRREASLSRATAFSYGRKASFSAELNA